MGFFIKAAQNSDQKRVDAAKQKLIRREAEIGGQLFGPVPKGHQRQFFCLDPNAWVWHENWPDDKGQQHVIHTRYDFLPNGVYKTQNGGGHQALSDKEAYNLYRSINLYIRRVLGEYQKA